MSIGSVSGIGSGWEQMQRQAMQQTMFKQMDQNGDGSITKSDLQTLAQNVSQTTGASINVDQVMSTLDTNKDGTIDQSEYDSAMQQFQSGGQQGQIHGHHHHHHHGAQQAGGSDGSADPLMALFQQMDQDGDGKVSQSEFQTGLQNLTQGSGDATGLGNLFAMLDTNGDGVIDQAEQAAAPQALANAGQPPPMPPPVQGSSRSPPGPVPAVGPGRRRRNQPDRVPDRPAEPGPEHRGSHRPAANPTPRRRLQPPLRRTAPRS